jgi:FkbM family methyltransferase
MLNLLRFIWQHPLASRQRMRALGRMVRWQLATRLLPEAELAMPFVSESRLLMRRGMTGATGNWYCDLHELHDMAFVLHLLRPGDLFVDVGANVGSYTVLAAAGVGARVVSVEPVPQTLRQLLRNVRLNDLGQIVEVHGVGVSDADGELRFSAELDTVNHVLVKGEQGASVVVPVRTLDALLLNQVPTLIKMDVEGFELPALKGAVATLAHPSLRALILETNGSGRRYGHSDKAIVDLLTRQGFWPHTYDGFERRLTTGLGGANTVFVRDPERVQALVSAAPRITLPRGFI